MPTLRITVAMKSLRLLRGLVGTSALWSLGFTVLAIPTVEVLLRTDAPAISLADWLRLLPPMLTYPMAMGAVSGAIFALLLAAFSQRIHSFSQLSVARMASLGAIAGMAMPFIFNGGHLAGLEAAVAGTLGLATATGSLLVARRSSSNQVGAAANSRTLFSGSPDNTQISRSGRHPR